MVDSYHLVDLGRPTRLSSQITGGGVVDSFRFVTIGNGNVSFVTIILMVTGEHIVILLDNTTLGNMRNENRFHGLL